MDHAKLLTVLLSQTIRDLLLCEVDTVAAIVLNVLCSEQNKKKKTYVVPKRNQAMHFFLLAV